MGVQKKLRVNECDLLAMRRSSGGNVTRMKQNGELLNAGVEAEVPSE